MVKNQQLLSRLTVTAFVLATFLSCNNSGDIPFPEKELGVSQPETVPLKFSAEKKLNWDTAKSGGIKPVVNKLDIDALPSAPYDSSGFRPFAQQPEEVHFDFNSLPDTALNLANLPSKPLQLKMSVLPTPSIARTSTPAAQKGKAISIFDLGQVQGLPAKFIGALYKDRNGLLWIGSAEGLFRYDGEHVQTFVAGSSSSPPISGIVEDNSGNIWYTLAGGGDVISVVDPKNGTIGHSVKIQAVSNNITKMTKDDKGNIWTYNAKDKSVSIIDPETRTYKNLDKKAGLSDDGAFDIMQDKDNKIWITTNSGGVDIIDPASGKIKYLKKANGLGSDSLSAITQDKKGMIWIAGINGLDAVDIKTGTIKHYNQSQGFRNKLTFSLVQDNKGRIWRNTVNGIELADFEKGMIRYIDQHDGLSGNVILAFAKDNFNRVWVGSISGLNIIDQDGETVHPLGTTNIISQIEDAVGNLWVATQNGILIVNAKRNTVRTLNKSNGLSNDFVQSYTKTNGNILVATNGGFNIIDPVRKTILSAAKKEGLVSDTIYSAFTDNTGNTWLTGPSNGVDLIDSVKNIIRHTDVAGGLSDNNIQDIKQDKNGMIWLATNKNGVDVVDMKAGTVKYLNDQPGLKDTCNRVMLEDKAGRMWIATDKGIYVADTKKGTLTIITEKQGLSDNRVLSLLEYNGSVVAGTNNKVTIITPPHTGNDTTKEWKISMLEKSEGLIKETNSWATDCITSNGEYLWGDNGITDIREIKENNDSVATFITGMNIMTQPQYFFDARETVKEDTLWTADTFFVKGKRPANTGYADHHILSWDSVSGAYLLPVNLSIPYDKNYMQFQFAQANLSRQDKTLYTYILEGIDKNWSTVSSNPYTENYLNLPSGKYTFKVSSKGVNGKWGTPAVFSFTISPPWYKTWWAYTLFALLGIGILRAYIVFRSRMLQKENRILEEKVALRTSQLQQSLEDLKATQTQLIQSEKMASLGELTAGIAHEIQNPLNFINNFSEVNTELIAEMKEEIEKGNMEEVKAIATDIEANEQKINHHGKRADGIVKGMLQHSRSGNRQKEPTNINTLADEYLRLAYHGLRAKDKSFNAMMKTDFDESIGSINVISQDIGRVILNLITNAFYSVTEKKKSPLPLKGGETYEPTVTVTTRRLGSPSGGGGKVSISVKDNGMGVPQKVLDKIFQPFFTTKPSGQGTGLGLSLSYDIIKAHGGELKVETKEGEGAEFIITLPV